VPEGALHVGAVPNMTLEAIRAYNAQQPTYYKLHRSDCRYAHCVCVCAVSVTKREEPFYFRGISSWLSVVCVCVCV